MQKAVARASPAILAIVAVTLADDGGDLVGERKLINTLNPIPARTRF
jgi:hypothetical protein